MRIGFAGTPEFARIVLASLCASEWDVVRVLTQPGRPRGRGQKPQVSFVEQWARANELPCYSPVSLKTESHLVNDLDVLVVAAYGLILPSAILEAPKFGCLNVHASLLPRWRGASPVEHALWHGDAVTGISIMQIERGLDRGPVYSQAKTPIGAAETGAELTVRLAHLGAAAIETVLRQCASGQRPAPTPQEDSLATYAPRLTANDARIQWQQPAAQVHRQIRAFEGRTAAFTTSGDLRVAVLAAGVVRGEFAAGTIGILGNSVIVGCGKDGLELHKVQLNRGKGRAITCAEARNGFPDIFRSGFRFDDQ